MKGAYEEMGMTDKQFAGFLRMLIKDLKNIQKEKEIKSKDEQIQEIIENLQTTIED